MEDFVSWLERIIPFLQSPLGAIFFIPAYAVWVTMLLPGIWASMLAGALYGTLKGTLIVFIGACLGAELSFLLGRTILRNWIRKKIAERPRLLNVVESIKEEGLKFIILTRLSPAFPFSILNLAYGISEVKIKDYTIGLIGILPGTILFCNLGDLAGEIKNFENILAGNENMGEFILKVIGLISTFLIIWVLSRNIKKN